MSFDFLNLAPPVREMVEFYMSNAGIIPSRLEAAPTGEI